MSMISRFDVESAIALINNGFDGSEANKDALIKAQAVLRTASAKLQKFASLKPGLVAMACNDKAQKMLDTANRVNFSQVTRNK